MRKITIIEHISLDGVIQAPGGLDEDRDGDFKYGGWIAPHSDPAIGEAIVAAHGHSFDLLLGRRTYDIWSAYWPTANPSPFADSFNAATKYVATHTPETLCWAPAKALGPDIVAGIRQLKTHAGPDLIVWGSSTLTPILLDQSLADEVLFITYPILLGTGKRFFSPTAAPCELALHRTKALPTGVLLSTYIPTGPLRTANLDTRSTR